MTNPNKTQIWLTLMLLFATCALPIFAQDRGYVLEMGTDNPLHGATITFGQNKTGAYTDHKGSFLIKDLPTSNPADTLHLSYVGYTPLSITRLQLSKQEYIAHLHPKSEDLQEVTVEANKIPLKYKLGHKNIAHLPKAIASFGSAMVDDKIYVIGGDESFASIGVQVGSESGSENNQIFNRYNNKMFIFDLKTLEWQTSEKKFRARAFHNVHHYNGKIYVLGGKRLAHNWRLEYLDETIEVYDIQNDKILIDKNTPHQSANFASSLYGDKILVVGGSVKAFDLAIEQKRYTAKCHLLDLRSGYWFQLDDLPQPKETQGVTVDSTLYLIGGTSNQPLYDIDSYNIATGKWTTAVQLMYPVEKPGIATHNKIIYILEGNRVQTFDTTTSEVRAYRTDISVKACQLFVYNDMLYILGGITNAGPSKFPSDNLTTIDFTEFNKTAYE